MAVLCVAAVGFLLRLLVALLREAMGKPPSTLKVLLAKFTPRKQLGELIVMTPPVPNKSRTRTDERIALAALLAVGLALSLRVQQGAQPRQIERPVSIHARAPQGEALCKTSSGLQ